MAVTSISEAPKPPVVIIAAPYSPAGPIVAGTSSTPNDVAIGGEYTFTMDQSGLGFVPGFRVRAAVATDPLTWIEGVVTTFTGNDLTIASDLTHGIGGIYNAWNINVAGEPGHKGDKGDTGVPGATGPQGIVSADSPTFTGDPKAPTPLPDNNSPSIATTQFVKTQLVNYQPFDPDLTSFAAITATAVIPYRSAADTWGALTIGTGLTVTGGQLQVTGGFQPADADLTSLAAASATDIIYYRSGSGTWAPITLGANVGFAGGVLSATGGTGGGGISEAPSDANYYGRRALGWQPIPIQADVVSDGNRYARRNGAWISIEATLTSFAPIDSPTFTTAAFAPTPTPNSDNSTKIATTAFVRSNVAGLAPTASPTFSGTVIAPTPTPNTDSSTKVATTAFVQSLIGTTPQGRLTLASGAPVMVASVAAATSIFYTPYIGARIPIFDGINMVATTFSELTAVLSDTTKNPAAIAAAKVNDWFVWSDAGTVRLSHGPDWSSDTTRALSLVNQNGIWLNASAITNGPAASRGTYVGTTRSDAAAGTISFTFGGANIGGWFGVWNCHNRVLVGSESNEATASWSYAATAWRPWNNQAARNRVSAVFGLAEDAINVASQIMVGPGASGGGYNAIGLDLTNAPIGAYGQVFGPIYAVSPARYVSTQIGFHFWQALETTDGVAAAFYGTGATSRCGLFFNTRM